METKNYNEIVGNLCQNAKEASRIAASLNTNERNRLLYKIAERLREKSEFIITENKKDLEEASAAGVSGAFYDRLLLSKDRINAMALTLEEIAQLEDPIGRIERISVRPSGIRVGQMRVPLGVIAVIFESRPNVTTDIAALCIKSGNSCILRGGKESIHSNTALHSIIAGALADSRLPDAMVTLITETDRGLVSVLLKMNTLIDIVIPRGGESLIQMVTRESTIPVIKHDKGICHIYVDESADESMAKAICVNAKVQRPGVCNAMETLLIHADYPKKESLLKELMTHNVEIRGCPRTQALLPGLIKSATENDWYAEYLDLILAVKIVDSLDEALGHITRYGSGHSEAIITGNHYHAERFLKDVDSAAVFVNASTRFHDGGEFGLGAEVGISTQKLHARGAMGVEGLTTLKYVIYGNGEIRK